MTNFKWASAQPHICKTFVTNTRQNFSCEGRRDRPMMHITSLHTN